MTAEAIQDVAMAFGDEQIERALGAGPSHQLSYEQVDERTAMATTAAMAASETRW